ncbi:MAG: hypothetical protein ABW136_13450 [Steroidobacteraceae bacterium]
MATYDADNHAATQISVDPALVTYTQIMYALHAVTVVIGIFTSAFIVTAFLFGIPSIIAVVMNYLRRNDARNTWLASHFRWQLRTFWFAALWYLAALVAFGWLALLVIGLPLLWGSFAIIGVWAAYRVIRGWLALRESRPLPI